MVQQQQLDNMTRFDGISEEQTPINSNTIKEPVDNINQNVPSADNHKKQISLQTLLPPDASSCTESHYNTEHVQNQVTPGVSDEFQISEQDFKLNAHKDAIYKSVLVKNFTLT